MSFPKLKREVIVRKSDLVSITVRAAVTSLVLGIFLAGVMIAGLPRGHRTPMPVACGISDPLACAVTIVESIADALVPAETAIVEVLPSQLPPFTVATKPTLIVDCAVAERAYWACIDDEACPLEHLEAFADDVNFCQTAR